MVPEGNRAIVEHVSVDCQTPVDNPVAYATVNVVLQPGTFTVPFQIPLRYQGRYGDDVYVGALMTRLYAEDTGYEGDITASVARQNGSGLTSCRFAINGRYLPIPAGESLPSVANSAAPDGERNQPAELIIPYAGGPLPEEAVNPPPGTAVKMLAPPE